MAGGSISRMRDCLWVTALCLFAMTSVARGADRGPTISVCTDKACYRTNDTVEISLGGTNVRDAMSVDVYLGLLTPSGSLYTLASEGWSDALQPWLGDFYVPSPYFMGDVTFMRLGLPCEMPPISDLGEYHIMAGVTNPGTLDFVTEVCSARFCVVPIGSSVYVDATLGDDANEGSPDDPFRTITQALASVEGSALHPVTIHAAAGTYAASTNGEAFPLIMRSWVSLSGADRETTVLDAEQAANHVVYCEDVQYATVEGFTISGGSAAGGWARGGGIHCLRSSPTILNNVISDNTARCGGGIYSEDSSPRIMSNVLQRNSAVDEGGGICCVGDGRPRVSQNRISGNYAATAGGIYSDDSMTSISHNTITHNSSDGVWIEGAYFGGVERMWDNMIDDNSACGIIYGRGRSFIIVGNVIIDNGGRGIDFCYADNAIIAGNTVANSRGGSGIRCGSGYAIITGNSISRNSGFGISACSHPIVRNNLITYNADGGIYIDGYGMTLENNTIAFNSGEHDWQAGVCNETRDEWVSITDCIVWGNGNDIYGCLSTYCCIEDEDEGEGNIHDDPMFVTGPLGDYYLDPRSPCIDAGSMSSEEVGLVDWTTQADERADFGVVDMGVHYGIPPGESPSAYIDSITPNPAVQGQDMVEFRGRGLDSDGTIHDYEWVSSLIGHLSSSAGFSMSAVQLTVGEHRVSLRVRDNQARWSEADVEVVVVLPNPRNEVFVDAEAGDDSGDGSLDRPLRTITRALDMVHGTPEKPVTVYVARGTYSASTNGEAFPLYMKSWVSLSGDDRETTILDAERAAYHVILCERVGRLAVQGFTITGGSAISESDGTYGGGIYCIESSPTIQDNKIASNQAYSGGGIYCYSGSPTISDNVIIGNTALVDVEGMDCDYGSSTTSNKSFLASDASRGGEVFCRDNCALVIDHTISDYISRGDGGGIWCYGSSPTISDNMIIGNTAIQGGGICCKYGTSTISNNTFLDNNAGWGGGLLCSDGSAWVMNNTISGNRGEGDGGGICCFKSHSLKISNNIISGNSAVYDGAGIYCAVWSSAEITENFIGGNTAEDWFSDGGGIYGGGSFLEVMDNVISGNSVIGDGGGICCSQSCSAVIRNNTVVANTATRNGGGVSATEDNWQAIADCIVWGNGDDVHNCSSTYCCIEDEDEGEGNIHHDPMFVTGPFGDYYLDPQSPCIDAGSMSSEEAGLSQRTTRADSTPDTGTVDIGYHYAAQ